MALCRKNERRLLYHVRQECLNVLNTDRSVIFPFSICPPVDCACTMRWGGAGDWTGLQMGQFIAISSVEMTPFSLLPQAQCFYSARGTAKLTSPPQAAGI
jgi:hypothetical protein